MKKKEEEPKDDGNLPTPDKPAEKPSTWDNLLSGIGKLTNQWSSIVSAFKTKRSSTLKEVLKGKGFDFFSQSAQIQISKGIKEEFIDKYVANLVKRIKVPEERKEDLEMALEEIQWGSSSVWTAFNTLFSIDTTGETKFCSILTSKNEEKGTYDFVFTDIKASFKLAPDVMVISKKLSVLGGIWEDDKDEQIKVPKSLTPEDIQTVLSFFQIIAFKGFADQFGIKVDFPKMD